MKPARLPRPAGTWTCLAAALLLFGGCALVEGEGPPPRLFTPHPKTTFDSDLPAAHWQLVVDPPLAPASIDTVRIAVRKSPLELDYYAGAAWADRVPAMVQTLLVSSFENSGKIVGVGRESASLRADFALRTDIRNFEVEREGGHAAAHVHIVSKLIQMPERVIVSDNSCDYKEDAAGDSLEAIVEAYNSALGRCMRRIVEWTLRTGAKIKPAQ
jgi:cholesterol transport system auxiliary component